MSGVSVELVTDLPRAGEIAQEWEALAVAASKPVASAAWVLAWWRHVASPSTEVRIVVLRDAGRLIGLAPFYVASRRRGVAEYRLMASDFGVCMEPLALAGREWELAEAVASALSAAEPRPAMLSFGPMPMASPWVTALSCSWPGRAPALARRLRVEGAPVVHLREPGYEEWFQTLSSKLRRELRRCERLFAEAGGTTRWSDASTLRADAESFARLHAGRWEGRSWSRLTDLGERLPDWLTDVGAPLIGEGRFGLCVLEIGGEPVCVDLHLSAGSEVDGVNVGWDQRYARLAPAKLAVLRVIEAAYEKGATRVGLGNGSLLNKVRMANGDDPVAWTALLAPTPRLPIAYGLIAPQLARRHARELLGRSLPEPWLERIRTAARGLPR
ncbi:MAG: glycosyl transferase group 1 [Solirubrobacterales bacterium]|jgi:CelD/BcsL family acetyltransferase involved in cellulose biosynthesis|nr:glycosyl transferase group 1 [Solirubrobacterales bacterium]